MSMQSVVDEVHGCPLDEIAAFLPSVVSKHPLTLMALATRIGKTGDLPPEEVSEACRAQLHALEDIEPAHLVEAMTEPLLQTHVDVALEWLRIIGFLEAFYPELEAT